MRSFNSLREMRLCSAVIFLNFIPPMAGPNCRLGKILKRCKDKLNMQICQCENMQMIEKFPAARVDNLGAVNRSSIGAAKTKGATGMDGRKTEPL